MNWTLQNRCDTIVQDFLTEGRHHFLDITDQIRPGDGDGQMLVFSRHTTAAIVINENEPLLLEDLKRCLDRMASPQDSYRHDDLSVRTVNLVENEPPNGHSHCQMLALGCSLIIPVAGGQLLLGRWQRVFLVELDSARPRQVVFQFIPHPAQDSPAGSQDSL